MIDSLAVGGAERVLVELVNKLGQTDVTPAVCVTRSDMSLASAIHPSIRVYRLNRQKTWETRALRTFGQIVRDQDIEIIHAHGYSSSHFVSAAKVVNMCSVPTILHAHSSEPPPRATQWAARACLDYFVGVSPQLVAWAQTRLGFPPSRTALLGNAIDTALYRAAVAADLSPYFDFRPSFVGLVIANVRPPKGLITLFRALAQSSFKNQLGVVIAGSLSNHEYVVDCQRVIHELNLERQVVFLGPRTDIPQLLAAADIGLLTSECESGPIALLEYLAAARPFVVTRVGQIGEMVYQAGLSAVVPPQAPADFAKALDELLSLSAHERITRGLAGQEFLEKSFSIDARIKQLRAIYSSRLERRQSGRANRGWYDKRNS